MARDKKYIAVFEKLEPPYTEYIGSKIIRVEDIV